MSCSTLRVILFRAPGIRVLLLSLYLAPRALASDEGKVIGHGDGRIHIIPSLSALSVKNGGKLTISAVVKAVAGVRSVEAEIRNGERIIAAGDWERYE